MSFTKPTQAQLNYAIDISSALHDDADLQTMDKLAMSKYISDALANEENRKKIKAHKREMMKHDYEMRRAEERKFQKPWLTDESLGGEWGLDAIDFGAQAWGDS